MLEEATIHTVRDCPFCGSVELRLVHHAVRSGEVAHEVWQIKCESCGALGPAVTSHGFDPRTSCMEKAALGRWNFRAHDGRK